MLGILRTIFVDFVILKKKNIFWTKIADFLIIKKIKDLSNFKKFYRYLDQKLLIVNQKNIFHKVFLKNGQNVKILQEFSGKNHGILLVHTLCKNLLNSYINIFFREFFFFRVFSRSSRPKMPRRL